MIAGSRLPARLCVQSASAQFDEGRTYCDPRPIRRFCLLDCVRGVANSASVVLWGLWSRQTPRQRFEQLRQQIDRELTEREIEPYQIGQIPAGSRQHQTHIAL